MFANNGWDIPTTWDDMLALSDKIAASGIKPWCAGIESGEATGWTATDWLEDVLLRSAGPDVYDQWVSHDIAFNDPQVAEALDTVGGILKNDKYVNGGFGDVKSIATTAFQDGGLPILDGKCALHRQASFYAANWPEGTDVSENGDVFAFYLPPISATSATRSSVVASSSRRSPTGPRSRRSRPTSRPTCGPTRRPRPRRTAAGSAPTRVSTSTTWPARSTSCPVEILQDPDAVFRFDGSDQMPGEVGAGSFWTEMTNWITGESTSDALDKIESSWPS